MSDAPPSAAGNTSSADSALDILFDLADATENRSREVREKYKTLYKQDQQERKKAA